MTKENPHKEIIDKIALGLEAIHGGASRSDYETNDSKVLIYKVGNVIRIDLKPKNQQEVAHG